MDITPKQLHYFKRELITEQLIHEINTLIKSPDIASIIDKEDSEASPFLRYIFQNMIIEFPLLKHTCGEDFWPKCKVFLNEFNKVNLDSYYTPRSSDSTKQRKMIQHKIQKSLVFAFCASIKTLQGQEESIRVNPQETSATTTAPLSPVSAAAAAAAAEQNDMFRVNIVTVRQIKEKKTLREVSHAEFLIETWFPHQTEPIYVGRRHGEFRRLRDQLKHHFKNMDIPPAPSKSTNTAHQQGFRENDRLLLRAFLYHLTGDPCSTSMPSKHQQQIQKSHILRKFLTDSPILFTVEEEKDTLLREAADKRRLDEQQQFQKELDKRVLELNETLEDLKKDILQPGGLTGVFDIIKKTPQMKDLPESLKKAFEWGRINFAFALHRQFLTSDTATENLNNLRRTHGLMPYRTMSVILRFSNPMSMVKSIMDLFLAQPFGGRSLFQRIIISNMNEESKVFEKDIKILEEKIQDKVLCQKVYNAVRTPLPENSNFRDYDTRTMEILALLGNDEIKPLLSAEQITMLATFDQTHETKKLVKHIAQLWELYARQYEQELMMNLVFQGVTGELLKEFISVFYQPLAQVYKAADISTTIRHVASFLDDLLQVIDELPADLGVTDTIQLFIDLVQRHEQHFYEFVHNVHSQEASKVFDELVQYLDKLFTFVAQGIPGKIDIWHSVEKAVSKEELPTLEQEIDAICQYRYQQKMYHFERQRRKLMIHHHGSGIHTGTIEGLAKIAADADQERQNDIFQYISQRKELVGVMGDFEEFQYEDDALHCSSISSSSDDDDIDDGQSSGSSLASRRSSKSSSSQISHVGIEKPVLKLIPRIVPYFVQDVVEMMRKSNQNINCI
ncbi:uncharacterized protein ATC70_004887 [Mucor velutinosus]|uniref:PX domain-containing protein n=1 Tax=Mucor velutinosus TaxID=708070 RepID=A0AAN7HXC3_9FUNG|nr:hypothetical protein ATC70_004887 [Mucor velutinosus]